MDLDMKIDSTLEAYFVAVALLHGTHPEPKFGIDRTQLAREIGEWMVANPGQIDMLRKIRANYRELGGKLLDTDPQWFFTKLADSYLNWLYMQEESKKLLADSLENLSAEAHEHAMAGRGIAQSKRGFKWEV